MEILRSIALTVLSAITIVLSFTIYLTIKIFTGKSRNDKRYAPVHATVFDLFFHSHELYDYETKIARTKPTFRFLSPQQSEIFTADPRNVEHILKTRFDNYSKGPSTNENLADLLGHGIFAVDGEKWKQQRKLASSEFSTRVRDFSCSVFRRNASKLVGFLTEFALSGEAFDAQDMLMRFTLDSIFKVGFGVELRCLDGFSKEGEEFMKAFDEGNVATSSRFTDPLWKLKRFFNTGSQSRLKKSIATIDKFVYSLITTKRKELAKEQDTAVREDILSRFLVESEKDPENMNDKYLRDIILSFMIVGKDTTAASLSWFLYMLCKNTLFQEKIVQEIRDVTSTHEKTTDINVFTESITDEALDQMHYLHATLSETLRLYPSVPVDMKCADSDDILPDGHRVNKGDNIYYIAYAMGRMTYIWGQDAEDFKPERWLKDGVFQPESPFKFISFHAGPRICLGKDFAYRQMKIVSIALLHFFRFKMADEVCNVRYKRMLTLHIKGGLHLCAIPRTHI
ncbi:PREDICTED: cytochrome P450 704C1-like isoform X2 [Camelina sativa]|uniref:Cytochrome P450 704C1-like isoform X2 n=1 Tax=Camelina sativa TaxID=90675 RepID=A0ABM0SLM7_CAMSA|nr:PREDICTED: cytochrome P450 704C1-like isoform X2 [Camelina sativa]